MGLRVADWIDGTGPARVAEVLTVEVGAPCALPLGLSPVSAGFPSPAEEYTQGRLDLNEFLIRNPAATVYVRAVGISMARAGILPGDVLAVDRSLTAHTGDIIIARIDGEDLVKRFKRTAAGEVWLLADAEDADAYPPLRVSPSSEFEVWGVVVGVARNTQEGRASARRRPG